MSFDDLTRIATQVYDTVLSKEGAATSVLLFLYGVSKRVPNSNAGKIVTTVQIFFDSIAAVFLAIGRLCNLIGAILHKVIASDGYGGTK